VRGFLIKRNILHRLYENDKKSDSTTFQVERRTCLEIFCLAFGSD